MATSYLSAADVADIAAVKADAWETALALSGQTCTILRAAPVRNPVSGFTEAYASVGTVDCVVSTTDTQTSPQDRRLGDALRAQTAVRIRVPAGADVRKDDRIRDGYGVEYEILGQPIQTPNAPAKTLAVVATT